MNSIDNRLAAFLVALVVVMSALVCDHEASARPGDPDAPMMFAGRPGRVVTPARENPAVTGDPDGPGLLKPGDPDDPGLRLPADPEGPFVMSDPDGEYYTMCSLANIFCWLFEW
jgi:hypothetical protein